MKKRLSLPPAETVISRLRQVLLSIPATAPKGREGLRREVLRLADAMENVRTLAKIRLGQLTRSQAARDRILAYLKLFVGRVIEGRELQIVGGIQEFARRVRELRVQLGYNISTGYSRDDLRPDQYVLESTVADGDAAEKWEIANKIRKQSGNARDRVLQLLRACLGKPVTGEQLAYVAKIREAARRIRELRREYGWRIVTKQTGRPDLSTGVYVLESEDKLPEHDREIPDDVYDQVLERDKYRCRRCGWSVEDQHPSGKRQFLELHHIQFHVEGGPNEPKNLVTLCNVHHDDAHRKNLGGKAFIDWLKMSRE